MGLFDIFKKKDEPHYDPNNVTIHDIRAGFIFEYDLKTWAVREEYIYDWGDEYFTREYKIDAGDESAFMHIDDNDETFITITNKVRVRSIDEDIPETVAKKERPPKKLEYKGIKLYRDSENPGYFSADPDNDKSWTELVSWDYYDEDSKHVLNIEQWGEREFEAAFGKVVKDYEISNIIPGEGNG